MRSPPKAFLLLTLGTIAFLIIHYGHVLRSPNAVLLSGDGDGLKNYFTYAWHAERDSNLIHYSGSSYPLGEHLFFTDGHPGLSTLVQQIPFMQGRSIGLLNTLLLLGLLFCAWSLYGLLRFFQLPTWAAAWGAFCIMVLQPQLFRLGGHLSLAHAWFIPLGWLLTLLSLRDATSWRWPILSCLTGCAAFLTHPYLGLMITGLQVIILSCAPFVAGDRAWRSWRHGASIALSTLLPMVIFLLILRFGDHVHDRPSAPGGADEYSTRVLSLIVPTHPPFSTPLSELLRYEALAWESWCYLGLTTLIMLIVVGAVQLRNWLRIHPRGRGPDLLGLSLLAGTLVLTFAMGLLLEPLGELAPMLKQFRGTGRFAWVFWYTCVIFCTVRAYHYLLPSDQPNRRVPAVVLFTLAIGFYAVEGWAYHERTAIDLGRTPNVFSPARISTEMQELIRVARSSGAVAIIPLPYPNNGSEHYQRDGREGALSIAYPIAFGSGLPLLAGVTSRTSLSQTRNLLALLAPTDFVGWKASGLPNGATLLVLRAPAPLDDDEQCFLERSNVLVANSVGELRTVAATDVSRHTGMQQLQRFRTEHGSWPLCGSLRVSSDELERTQDPCRRIRTAAFDHPVEGLSKDYTTLIELPAGSLDTGTYELGLMFTSLEPAALNTSLIMERFTPGGHDNEWALLKNMRAMPMQSENSTIGTMRFHVIDANKAHKFFLNGPPGNAARFVVSNVLIRPLDLDCWHEGLWTDTPTVFRNNVPLITP